MKASKVFASALLACLVTLNTPARAAARNLQADMVVLAGDIFKIDSVLIEKTRGRLTIMDGRVIYEPSDAGKR